ncbi:DUF4192 domain-containing protein [Planobispora takensis]|uniref:DUF4192 domain-containing protein n=1 Tax=Planobispora takensis TaxID=1367882 RepID=A0A8J3SX56_9ACTN|nr:DUF4192 domain-containing protein [Planobispora takensis]GII00421.1 hypothetical protein Pta02_24290 [Planobispora takensis]
MTTDTTDPHLPAGQPHFLLGSAEDVLGAVPYLLGFHPDDSLVIIGLKGGPPRGRVHLTVRWDLPLSDPGLGRTLPMLHEEGITQVIAIGYGPGPLVTPAADAVMALFHESGVALLDMLRAEEGRYWSYICSRTDCCPPSGTPYDREAGTIAAQAIVHGLVALPDREALERSLDPVDGPERAAMRRATARVVEGMRRRLRECDDVDGLAAEIVADGVARVHGTIGVYASGGRIDDEQAARLGLDLAVIRIRDEAWTLITDETHEIHLRLWCDLTRRLEPRFVSPVASLLGMAAWRSGDSALAGIALARARRADPGYSMANLLLQALHHLLPPQALQDRMPSPDELDQEMGSPGATWLLPLAALLDEGPCPPVPAPRR